MDTGTALASGSTAVGLQKIALHHKSVVSQQIYTEKDVAETVRTIQALQPIHGPFFSDLAVSVPSRTTFTR